MGLDGLRQRGIVGSTHLIDLESITVRLSASRSCSSCTWPACPERSRHIGPGVAFNRTTTAAGLTGLPGYVEALLKHG